VKLLGDVENSTCMKHKNGINYCFNNRNNRVIKMSYALYIGKNHTVDGLSYLAGYGDEPSSHWIEIINRAEYSAGNAISVGVNSDADMPGQRIEIPQVAETARHIRVSYTYYKGVPPPITNGGLNEYGVAIRDVWSPSRAELIAITNANQTGPNYSDLARLILERAKTARQAVQLIGELIAQYGESTYGGNSHLIADSDEAWVVIQFAGSQGLWAAERLGASSIRASRPGYILNIPVGEPDHEDFLYSDNLVSFAIQQGWYVPGEPFNVNAIYGDNKGRWEGVQWIEGEMIKRSERSTKIGIVDVMWAIRTTKLTGDTAGYGQVVPLLADIAPELRVLWHAHIGALAAPFLPTYMGVTNVPEEFRQHRYLSIGESSRFLDARHFDQGEPESRSRVPQAIESTRSATAIFKRLLYLLVQHGDEFLPEVTDCWEKLEADLISQQGAIVRIAQILLDQPELELAQKYLTYYNNTEFMKALQLGEILAASMEARTRLKYGIKESDVIRSFEQIW
jgi:dipeptidase